MDAKRDSSILNFDSKLELDVSDTNQFDREQFIYVVIDEVNYCGIKSFFAIKWVGGTITRLLKDSHAFTVNEVIHAYKVRLIEPVIINDTLN